MHAFAKSRTAPASPEAQPARAYRRTPAVRHILRAPQVQTKLKIGAVDDPAEREADRVADQVMRMPDRDFAGATSPPPAQASGTAIAQSAASPRIQRLCPECEHEMQRKEGEGAGRQGGSPTPETEARVAALGSGAPLPASERAFFEPRFGQSLANVRVHSGGEADEVARAVNARAFTLGRDIAFADGEFRPGAPDGRRLIAHELTHTLQQRDAGADQKVAQQVVPAHLVQRALGDGHDLASPRFSRLLDLEAAYDGESTITTGSSGRGVQAIQQALYDLGFLLPVHGADGDFGNETKAAVEAFQNANALSVDGVVGPDTMAALDARFGLPVLPAAGVRSGPWTDACVRSVLCPWSPHTIDVLRTRITLKSFDKISFADERWDGAAWVPNPFPGGGFNTGTEIGVLNSSCEEMAETLYHEVLHAEQPTSHTTTLAKESYAYRIGEEFSIALGLAGRPGLRSADAQGREFADRGKVGTFVAKEHPSVPSGGGSEEIIDKAATFGDVQVRRANGTIYTRAAAVGETVPGPMTVVHQVVHPTAGWTC
jgi:hypothetical protein